MLVLVLAGCAIIPAPRAYPTITPRPTFTPAPTSLPGPTPSPSPTAIVPAAVGTALPIQPQPLSAGNAARLALLARLGRGIALQASLSPDGTWLGVTSTRGWGLWQSATLVESTWQPLDSAVRSLAFTPSSSMLAVGTENGQVLVYSLPDAALQARFNAHAYAVLGLAFSPDGLWLASAGWDKTVRLWSTSNWEQVQIFTALRAGARQVAFSPDSSRLYAWTMQDQVKTWSLPDGSQGADIYLGQTKTGQSAACLAFSPDGSLLAACQDARLRVMRTSNATSLALFSQFTQPPSAAAFSADGSLLAIISAGQVQVWRLSGQTLLLSIPIPSGFSASALPVFTADSSRLLLVAGMIQSFPLEGEDEPLQNPAGFTPGTPIAAAFTADGTLLLALSAGGLWSLDLPAGTFTPASLLPGGEPLSIALLPSLNLAATAALDKKISLWNPQTGEILLTLPVQPQAAGLLAFSPGTGAESLWLAGGFSNEVVRVWQVAPGAGDFGSLLVTLQSPAPLTGLTFSPDGSFLAASTLSGIQIWETGGWQGSPVIPGFSPRFSPAGTLASLTLDGHSLSASLRQPFTASPAQTWSTRGGTLAFSSDGALLVESGSELVVWQVNLEGIPPALFRAPNPLPFAPLLVSPDGTYLVQLGWDGTIFIWGAQDEF